MRHRDNAPHDKACFRWRHGEKAITGRFFSFSDHLPQQVTVILIRLPTAAFTNSRHDIFNIKQRYYWCHWVIILCFSLSRWNILNYFIANMYTILWTIKVGNKVLHFYKQMNVHIVNKTNVQCFFISFLIVRIWLYRPCVWCLVAVLFFSRRLAAGFDCFISWWVNKVFPLGFTVDFTLSYGIIGHLNEV